MIRSSHASARARSGAHPVSFRVGSEGGPHPGCPVVVQDTVLQEHAQEGVLKKYDFYNLQETSSQTQTPSHTPHALYQLLYGTPRVLFALGVEGR